MNKQDLAIASCRVSSTEQLDNNSLGRQAASVQKAAEGLGVPIVRQWSGSVSSKRGNNLKRKDIDEMITLATDAIKEMLTTNNYEKIMQKYN